MASCRNRNDIICTWYKAVLACDLIASPPADRWPYHMRILSFGSPPTPSSRQSSALEGAAGSAAPSQTERQEVPSYSRKTTTDPRMGSHLAGQLHTMAVTTAATSSGSTTTSSSSSMSSLNAIPAAMDLVPSTSTGSLLASQTLDRAMASHTLQDHTMKSKLRRARRTKRPIMHSMARISRKPPQGKQGLISR